MSARTERQPSVSDASQSRPILTPEKIEQLVDTFDLPAVEEALLHQLSQDEKDLRDRLGAFRFTHRKT